MILLVVTREATGPSDWQPKERLYFWVGDFGSRTSQVHMELNNSVLNDASYLTWYIQGVIMISIDTAV